MSKGFDNQAVGLAQLYSQTRAHSVANSATAAGAIIRGNGVKLIAEDAGGQTVRVRAIINNNGSPGGIPVHISYATTTIAAVLSDVTVGIGTLRGTSVGTLAGFAGGSVTVMPDAVTGAIDVTLHVTAAVALQGLALLIQAGNEFVQADLTIAA